MLVNLDEVILVVYNLKNAVDALALAACPDYFGKAFEGSIALKEAVEVSKLLFKCY